MLQVKKVSKSYGSVKAVRQVSLDLKEGEILGILGESGSGKSTLLRLLAGLEEPDQGQILLNEQPFTPLGKQLIPGHPQIRMLRQDAALLPRHRIYENLQIELRNRPEKYQNQRIKELSKLCKLEKLLHQYPHELSGGQKQRAALAKALANQPKIVLLDEAFSHMDSHLKPQIRGEISEIIQESGAAAVLVSHDAQDVLSICDRVAVMYQGKILQINSPRTVYFHPVNPYVAAFLGLVNILNMDSLTEIQAPHHPRSQVCIRPESIRIDKDAADSWEAKVVQLQFMGHFSMITAALRDGQTLRFFTDNTTVIQPGQLLRLTINVEDIRFFE